MTFSTKLSAPSSHAETPVAAFDDRCDFILFLQRRLHVNRRQARNLLSAWMQEFKPEARAAREGRGRA